ncbi:P-loop containing nucleoside triphosphate hydrolase protein, partial [Nadsonia fulvescens var. elongata DSM 6958]
ENNFGVPVNSLLSSIEADKVIQANQPKSVDLPKATLKGTLWTEKWRPKSWIDLIGNERTHRQLLAWLKTWSKCVFNEESIHDGTEFDPLGRPERKILLIHGPPGIGKTTIAHVIARQAGYEVLEINASDERGGTLVKEKIIGATESHRVDDNKPVCIIADEIEGSSEAGFIRILVDMINSDKKACEHLRNNVKTFKSNKERKKKKSSLLLRPIIAICNDVYANSLRNLRPLAEVIQYKRVPPSMMITKLKQICSLEKVVVDTKKLTEVVNQVEGDMRSALNILQFGKSKSNSSEKKDINVGWSNIVNRVFHRGSGISREDETSKILATVDMCGEYDKLVSGCFSLYPEMQYHDDMVLKPGKIGDWLFFFDELNKGVYQSQHHQLEEYFSQAVLAFYSFFSSTTNVHNMRPKSDFEHFQAKNASMEFITQLLNDVPARISQMFKKADVPMELAPYLMRILSPNVQPVNMALVKTIEKE